LTDIIKVIIETAKSISDVHYFKALNEHYEEIYNLSCRISYGNSLDEAMILFEDVCDFTITIDEKAKLLGQLNIIDVSDEGWETRKYFVRDLEPEMEDDFKLMCNRIIMLE